MDYVIHSYGGGAVLAQIFEGIARIFQTDKTYVTPMLTFAMTIGGVWAMILGVFKENVGIMGKRWLMPTLMIVTLFFQPKATVWIKDEVSMQAPIKVDHVPFVVAFFPSVASKIFYATTYLLEEALMPVSNTHSHKTGVLFGARVMAKLQSLRIEDPVLLENTKAFCKQCFTKPWIMGNFLGKRKDAMSAKDILAFTKDNPAENFGIYYKDPKDHSLSFKTCKVAQGLLEADIRDNLLAGSPLNTLSSALGLGTKGKETELNVRLHAITKDTLEYLNQESSDVHQWMKQSMLLNANREGLDDWKESLGIDRVYPELVSMQASRGIFQQSFGWLTAGEMASEVLPLLQTVLFAVLIAMIFLVFPMCLLPGGFDVLKTWILGMIWVNSWPLFWAIIHMVGMMFLSHKATTIGPNSILSGGALGEVSLNLYAICQLLSATVPMIAWAVLSRSVQTFAGLTERLSPIGAGGSLGNQMVDNTINMDNISVGNRQMAQAAMGPALTMGSRVTDGGMLTMQSTDGRSVVQEQQSSGKLQMMGKEAMTEQLSSQEMAQTSRLQGLNKQLNESKSSELADAISKGEVLVDGWSESDMQSFRDSYQKGRSQTDGIHTKDSKGARGSNSISASAGAEGGFGIPFTNIGVKFSTNMSGSQEMHAGKDMSSDSAVSSSRSEGNSYEATLSDGRTVSFQATNDQSKKLLQNMRSHQEEQQGLVQSVNDTEQTLSSIAKTRQQVESMDQSTQANLMDDALQSVMADTGKTKQEAMHYLEQNPDQRSHYRGRAMEHMFGVQEGTFTSPVDEVALKEAVTKVSSSHVPSRESFERQASSHMEAGKTSFESQMGQTFEGQKAYLDQSNTDHASRKEGLHERASSYANMGLQQTHDDLKEKYNKTGTDDLNKERASVTSFPEMASKALGSRADDSSLTMQPKFGKMGNQVFDKSGNEVPQETSNGIMDQSSKTSDGFGKRMAERSKSTDKEGSSKPPSDLPIDPNSGTIKTNKAHNKKEHD